MQGPRGPGLAPPPLGTGAVAPLAALPPVPAAAPRSPYDPVFNPIISKASATQLQSQGTSFSSLQQAEQQQQTVSANSNGVVTTYNTPQPAGGSGYGTGTSSASGYGSGTQGFGTGQGSGVYGQGGQQYSSSGQQQGASSTYGGGGQQQTGWTGGQQASGGGQQYGSAGQQSYGPVLYVSVPLPCHALCYCHCSWLTWLVQPCRGLTAPAPAPQVAATNSMVAAVDLAQQRAQSNPQFSFGQVAHAYAQCAQRMACPGQHGCTS